MIGSDLAIVYPWTAWCPTYSSIASAIARRLASVGEDKPQPASGLAERRWRSSR